jgi:Bacterial antitoxin of type II TA system, VapB
MAMKLAIDPDLIAQALELSGDRTESAVVTRALQEFIARMQQQRLLYLIGRFEWDRSYDYKAGRSRDRAR